MKLALIGAGQRGMIYAEYAFVKKNVEIVAVVEPHEERRKIACDKFGVKEENRFANVEELKARMASDIAEGKSYHLSKID